MSEINHTPLPWRASGTIIYTVDVDERGYVYAVGGCNGHNFVEDMKFIVRACNNHYDLLQALKISLKHMENRQITSAGIDIYEQTVLMPVIKQALNKATAGIDRTSTTNLTEK